MIERNQKPVKLTHYNIQLSEIPAPGVLLWSWWYHVRWITWYLTGSTIYWYREQTVAGWATQGWWMAGGKGEMNEREMVMTDRLLCMVEQYTLHCTRGSFSKIPLNSRLSSSISEKRAYSSRKPQQVKHTIIKTHELSFPCHFTTVNAAYNAQIMLKMVAVYNSMRPVFNEKHQERPLTISH